MDSTGRVDLTCDACPFKGGCPAFSDGRRACLVGSWPLTSAFGLLAVLAAIAAVAQLLVS